MKVLLLVPKRYGFHHSFKETFSYLGGEIFTIDFSHEVKPWKEKVNTQIFRFPHKYRVKWESYYLKGINEFYIKEYNRIKPDVVFIYNHELMLPETLAYIKKKSKVGFFLGDIPYYTPGNRHFMTLLNMADAVYTYDSFWIDAMKKVGIKNIHYLYPNIPKDKHYEKKLASEVYEELKSEVIYIGMCYKTSWGYKKAKFMSCFTDFDLHIHGDESWKRWFEHFPELEKHFIQRQGGPLTADRMNDLYNASKIAPVDASPGLLHALHWRWVEALGSGVMPVLEWQQNIVEIFGDDKDLPVVKVFDEAREVTAYYLNNEKKRVEMVDYMRSTVEEKYSIENNARFIAETMPLKGVSVLAESK